MDKQALTVISALVLEACIYTPLLRLLGFRAPMSAVVDLQAFPLATCGYARKISNANFKRTLASTTMRKQKTSCVERLACPNGFVSTYSRIKAVAITERDGIRAAPTLYEGIGSMLENP